MKKILVLHIFIWCFLPLNTAFATCSLTGGACRIDDLIEVKSETLKKENSLNKKEVEQKQIKQNQEVKKKFDNKNVQTDKIKRDKI